MYASLCLPSFNANSAVCLLHLCPHPQLPQAQVELQAYEAHLVAKERELDARRIAVAHDGLGTRCHVLIDFAAVWAGTEKPGLGVV